MSVILEHLTQVSDKETPVHGRPEGHEVRDGGAGDEDVLVGGGGQLVGVGVLLVGHAGAERLHLLSPPAGLKRNTSRHLPLQISGENIPRISH